MTNAPASTLQAGDVILPPARELRLWMRRDLAEHNLPETTLHITVSETYQNGRWIIIRGTQNNAERHTATGAYGGKGSTWTIKALPHTSWPVVRRAGSED